MGSPGGYFHFNVVGLPASGSTGPATSVFKEPPGEGSGTVGLGRGARGTCCNPPHFNVVGEPSSLAGGATSMRSAGLGVGKPFCRREKKRLEKNIILHGKYFFVSTGTTIACDGINSMWWVLSMDIPGG